MLNIPSALKALFLRMLFTSLEKALSHHLIEGISRSISP